MPGLGYVYADDARDHLARAAALPFTPPSADPPRLRVRAWRAGPSLDQGRTGTCVAHGGEHWMQATPVGADLARGAAPSPFDVYRELVVMDEFAENDGEAGAPDAGLRYGTSVRTMMRWLQRRGYLKEYVRALTVTEEIQALQTLTPVLTGTDWGNSMSEPDADGIARFNERLGTAGGHCYLLLWFDRKRDLFLCQQSWGHGWGVDNPYQKNLAGRRGFFWMIADDREKLMRRDAESWIGVEVRRPRPRPAPPAAPAGPGARVDR